MWTTDPETPAGEAVRPTDKAPRATARSRAGATDSRDDANAREGRQGRRRRGAQENAEAVRALQQDADASSEDEGRPDVLLV